MQVNPGTILQKNGIPVHYYLVSGKEKTALIDTAPEEYINDIISALNKTKIDYIIFTNTDRSRTGALRRLIKENSSAEIVATVAGLRNLHEILNADFNEHAAKDGEIIDLGKISLQLMVTPRLSWPDTMMIYIPTEKALISGSMFVSDGDGRNKEYFINNFAASSEFVKSAVCRIKTINVDKIYPSEGTIPISAESAVNKYDEYLKNLPSKNGNRAAIVYAGRDNGYTAELVEIVADKMRHSGFDTQLINCTGNVKEAVNAINRADVLCFASPTVNRRALPEIMDVISRIDGMNMRRTPCMVVGSYGWGGEALGVIANYLKLLGMKVFDKPFGVIFKPSDEDKVNLRNFTNKFIEGIKKYDNK